MSRRAHLAFIKLYAVIGTLVIIGIPITISLYINILVCRILGFRTFSDAFNIQVTSWWILLIFWYIQSLFATFIYSILYYTSKVVYKHRDLFFL